MAKPNAAELIELGRARLGCELPIDADVCAYRLNLWLAPHSGVIPVLAPHEAAGAAGVIVFDERLPQAVQERLVALACARHIAGVEADEATVDAVATGLCGLAKPLAKATASMLLAAADCA